MCLVVLCVVGDRGLAVRSVSVTSRVHAGSGLFVNRSIVTSPQPTSGSDSDSSSVSNSSASDADRGSGSGVWVRLELECPLIGLLDDRRYTIDVLFGTLHTRFR
jgi:hypothetical protein